MWRPNETSLWLNVSLQAEGQWKQVCGWGWFSAGRSILVWPSLAKIVGKQACYGHWAEWGIGFWLGWLHFGTMISLKPKVESLKEANLQRWHKLDKNRTCSLVREQGKQILEPVVCVASSLIFLESITRVGLKLVQKNTPPKKQRQRPASCSPGRCGEWNWVWVFILFRCILRRSQLLNLHRKDPHMGSLSHRMLAWSFQTGCEWTGLGNGSCQNPIAR